MMKLTYIGHSAFLFDDGTHRVIVDPFIEGNPKAAMTLDEVKALNVDAVILSHAHGDHWGNALDLTGDKAPLIATYEIAMYAGKHGASNTVPANIGGTVKQPWGSVTFTPAWHSSSFPDGTYGGMPTGLVLEMGGVRTYFAGDTALFSDMTLIGDTGLDLAILPIGDQLTMGAEQAAACLKLLRPKAAVPCHYGTFPFLASDPQPFVQAAGELGVKAYAIQPGESQEF